MVVVPGSYRDSNLSGDIKIAAAKIAGNENGGVGSAIKDALMAAGNYSSLGRDDFTEDIGGII